MNEIIDNAIQTRADYARLLADSRGQLCEIVEVVTRAIRAGNTIFTCGNGGSAAESLHLAEELIGRFRADRRPLPAISLVADSTALTCIGNDYGFAEIFARQVEALGRPGDVLIGLSTSGKSPNVLKAFSRSREKGMKSIGLLGKPGSAAEALCDVSFTPATDDSALVQELHLAVIHIALTVVDNEFLAS